MTHRTLSVLCLHGTCQDGEIFSQRLKPLQDSLSGLVRLTFIHAPHSLHLTAGQQVPMRTWWRTKSMILPSSLVSHDRLDSEASEANRSWAEACAEASMTSWQDVVISDWQVSMKVIREAWEDEGGFDGILGFSNGAAAAFALVANALAIDPNLHTFPSCDRDGPLDFPPGGSKVSLPGLKFIITAGGSDLLLERGGYLPDPLGSLIPCSMVETQGDEGPGSWLRSPLPLPSFHFMGRADEAVPVQSSRTLSRAFASPVDYVHEGGHSFPTSSDALSTLSAFLQHFQPMDETFHEPMHEPRSHVKTSRVNLSSRVVSKPAQPQTSVVLKPAQPPVCPPLMLPLSNQGDPAQTLPPPQDQLDEIEVLESIFGSEFQMQTGSLASSPISFSIVIQSPPISTPFTLLFNLPNQYPAKETPAISFSGHLVDLNHDFTSQLHNHLVSHATELMDISEGAGCIFQLVEAARDFIDANIKRFIDSSVSNSATPVPNLIPQGSCEEKVGPADGPRSLSSRVLKCSWWEEEEADSKLIRAAILKASLRHWGACYGGGGAVSLDNEVEDEDETGADDDRDDDGDFLGQRGRWDYVVGLVGQPSAGKSTFFNATTVDADSTAGAGSEARCASFPFTTIEPNISRGMKAVPDPSGSLAGLTDSLSRPAHGFTNAFDPTRSNAPTLFNLAPLQAWMSNPVSDKDDPIAAPSSFFPWATASDDKLPSSPAASSGKRCWRKVPVLVKDVAGLVPGAYRGRGKGNSFLNDLTDADVLIHVVDASGSTDKEGQSVGEGLGADPLDDIGWVREEIHRWVFDNVRSKWPSVLKRPSKLPDLFSGYKASRALVRRVLQRAGLNMDHLDEAGLMTWGEGDLHMLVATFLQIRFPILLAMNKADMRGAVDHIERVRRALPHEPLVSMSAAAERWLCGETRAGRLLYEPGSNRVTTPGLRSNSEAVQIEEDVGEDHGSEAFPVGDIQRCTAVAARPTALMVAAGSQAGHRGGGMLGAGSDAKQRVMEGSSPSVLRDCVLMKPGSSIHHLYYTLKRPPWSLLEGDYIRSDCKVMSTSISISPGSSSGDSRVLKKDEKLGWNNCVVRIMTNKKPNWQKT